MNNLLLFQVNNASLDNVTHEQAVGILKSSSDTVVLFVYRDSSSFVYEGSLPPHSPVDETGNSLLSPIAWFAFHRNWREHVILIDVLEYCYTVCVCRQQ